MLDPMTALDKVKAGDGKASERPRRLTRAPDSPAGVLPNPKPTIGDRLYRGFESIGRYCTNKIEAFRR